jgi:nitroimidazol reductase NimA-like FMN-containing flavoprotein (pyridoxamine 5'-phosphate oxidase superfamily)
MTGERFEPTPRTTPHRLPERGTFDKKTLYAILDEGFIAHVGFADNGQPFVLPMAYGRAGDKLYLHGSAASRQLRALAAGAPACVTVTLMDGLVLARSLFNHSMNYRCAVVLGQAKPVTDPATKVQALKVVSDHMLAGRWEEARVPSESELKQTLVVELALAECSAKVRTGPPEDEDEDYALPVWAGIVPSRMIFETAIPDPKLNAGIPLPKSVAQLRGLVKRPRPA